MRLLLYFLLIFVTASSCSITRHDFNSKNDYEVALDTLRLYDAAREREIPIAVYQPVTKLPNEKIVIFSHGYGHNYQKNYLVYSYLTDVLASKGYFVVSIQHELPTDSILPFTGIPQVVRLPFWERGVENILFVINSLKKTNPELNFEHIALIGHSNGGDTLRQGDAFQPLTCTVVPAQLLVIPELGRRWLRLTALDVGRFCPRSFAVFRWVISRGGVFRRFHDHSL